MTPSLFSERFGYARWLRHLATGEAPGFAEVGRAVERTGQAVSAWSSAEEAPVDWRVHGPLARFLDVEENWLIKNVGEPPLPDLWRVWTGVRRKSAPPARRVAEPAPPVYATQAIGETGDEFMARAAKEKAAREGGHKGGGRRKRA